MSKQCNDKNCTKLTPCAKCSLKQFKQEIEQDFKDVENNLYRRTVIQKETERD